MLRATSVQTDFCARFARQKSQACTSVHLRATLWHACARSRHALARKFLLACLEHQFTHLIGNILKDLCSSSAHWPSGLHRVIVIDGLDECIDRRVQKQILRIISNAVRAFELPILFLVASRPEHDINVAFASREMTGIFTRLYLDDTVNSDEDIRTFLNDSFDEIKTTHPFKRSIPALWPPSGAVDTLVRKSSGQFVFAATVVRFVESIRHQPHLRLDVVLTLRPPEGELPFAQLDALYAVIL